MTDDDRADPPIACSLPPRDLARRLADMRSLGRTELLGVHTASREATLRFRRGDQTRERLEGLVAAEAACCAFLDFGLDERDDAIVVTIRAPEGAEPAVGALVVAFAGDAGLA